MSILAVVLPLAGEAQPSWSWVLGGAAGVPPTHGEGPIALLPRPDGATQVVAVVSAAALSWHRVDLPQGVAVRSPRLRAVLEGLLEDRLLDEPTALHFALEPGARAGAPAWVAACDRAWLAQRLHELDAAGRNAARVVPEFEPTPSRALHATGTPGQALLTATGEDGVIHLPLPTLPDTNAARWDGVALVAEPAVAEEAERILQRSAAIEPAAQRLLRAAASRWELAQLDLAQALQARRWKKVAAGFAQVRQAPQWRAARWAAVLLVAVNLIGLNALAWKERSALERKRAEVRTILTETFPGTPPVDPPVQMQRQMALLRQGSGALDDSDLEPVLEALALASPPDRHPAAVEFAAGETRVRGIDAGAAMPTLQARGLEVRNDSGALTVRRRTAR